ncbi:hypothetical protein BB559_001102 [Furculomyces boomerangus]|uniref:Uncharacterized protein n=2 Tax=Harpellales TaxID=61421 RepID=A0A2T9XZ78_9FUNG|nr:hypothetical protein BB559_007063 [Furculomyces boomerangus]PVU98997.1 hypothetical protein BB559_001102 [Furculomyces boomerangus]PVZ97788.1 hypothetical protein BB558_006254 [Smittium angustum]
MEPNINFNFMDVDIIKLTGNKRDIEYLVSSFEKHVRCTEPILEDFNINHLNQSQKIESGSFSTNFTTDFIENWLSKGEQLSEALQKQIKLLKEKLSFEKFQTLNCEEDIEKPIKNSQEKEEINYLGKQYHVESYKDLNKYGEDYFIKIQTSLNLWAEMQARILEIRKIKQRTLIFDELKNSYIKMNHEYSFLSEKIDLLKTDLESLILNEFYSNNLKNITNISSPTNDIRGFDVQNLGLETLDDFHSDLDRNEKLAHQRKQYKRYKKKYLFQESKKNIILKRKEMLIKRCKPEDIDNFKFFGSILASIDIVSQDTEALSKSCNKKLKKISTLFKSRQKYNSITEDIRKIENYCLIIRARIVELVHISFHNTCVSKSSAHHKKHESFISENSIQNSNEDKHSPETLLNHETSLDAVDRYYQMINRLRTTKKNINKHFAAILDVITNVECRNMFFLVSKVYSVVKTKWNKTLGYAELELSKYSDYHFNEVENTKLDIFNESTRHSADPDTTKTNNSIEDFNTTQTPTNYKGNTTNCTLKSSNNGYTRRCSYSVLGDWHNKKISVVKKVSNCLVYSQTPTSMENPNKHYKNLSIGGEINETEETNSCFESQELSSKMPTSPDFQSEKQRNIGFGEQVYVRPFSRITGSNLLKKEVSFSSFNKPQKSKNMGNLSNINNREIKEPDDYHRTPKTQARNDESNIKTKQQIYMNQRALTGTKKNFDSSLIRLPTPINFR